MSKSSSTNSQLPKERCNPLPSQRFRVFRPGTDFSTQKEEGGAINAKNRRRLRVDKKVRTAAKNPEQCAVQMKIFETYAQSVRLKLPALH